MPTNAGQDYITENAFVIHGTLINCRNYCPIICLIIFENYLYFILGMGWLNTVGTAFVILR